jgi:hypothetical protein
LISLIVVHNLDETGWLKSAVFRLSIIMNKIPCHLLAMFTFMTVVLCKISGKHRKHPGGRGNAGGQHHHRINFDK